MENNRDPQVQPNPAPVMDIQPVRPAQTEQPVPAPEQQPDAPAAASEATPVADPTPVLAAIVPKHKSHRTPVLAIVCAVLIAGVFATIAVMVYLSNPNAEQANDVSQQPTSGTVQQNTATTDDVAETEKAIDESLSGVDDAADYDESSVSDTTLGL